MDTIDRILQQQRMQRVIEHPIPNRPTRLLNDRQARAAFPLLRKYKRSKRQISKVSRILHADPGSIERLRSGICYRWAKARSL